MTSNQKDKLTEIPIHEWPNLRDLFKDNWPEHLLAYSTVANRIQLKEKFPEKKFQIFGLNNDWSDGTFILVDEQHRSIYTLEKDCNRLKRAMLLHDWSSKPRIAPYMSQHKSTVEDVFHQLGYELEFNIPTGLWWLPKEKGIQFDLETPDDIYLSSLKLEHTEAINSVWPFRSEDTIPYLNELIIMNRTIALFGKEKNDLRAWILRLNNGTLTALQTDEKHFRKGYGGLALRAMAKGEAEDGRDTFGGIVEDNKASAKLFAQHGFKNIGVIFWCRNKTK